MEKKNYNLLGKKLSFILRHNPSIVGGNIDSKGWMSVSTLTKEDYTLDDLIYIVNNDKKGRFEFSKDFSKIRALQGHSIPNINADLEKYNGNPILFHGTKKEFVPSILKNGLKKMKRNYVHLSQTIEEAIKVANRWGPNIAILKVDISGMDNVLVSRNGVIQVSYVEPSRIVELIL